MSKNTIPVPSNLLRTQPEQSLFSYVTNKYVLGAIALIIIAVAVYWFFIKKKKKVVNIESTMDDEKEINNEKKEELVKPEPPKQ